MNPIIDEISETDGALTFRMSGVNVSIVNGLRRIVYELPTVVLKSTPQDSQKIVFSINTTRFNNEIIKQRLGCIPVYADTDFPFSQYEIIVDKQNTFEDIIYITTEDFKVVDINTQLVDDKLTKKLFPINQVSGYYPELVRLLPNLINKGKGEHLKFKCKFSISSSMEDGMFNITSTCTYSNTIDVAKQDVVWKELQALESNNTKDEFLHTDWLLLDGKRIVKPNSFEFKIETVGPVPNITIIHKACKLFIDKLSTFKNSITDDIVTITEAKINIPNSYDFTLVDEDFTLGKVIEFILYTKFYETKKIIFCGFRKPHPHINESIIRIAFLHKPDITRLKEIMVKCADDAIEIYRKIGESFTSDVMINSNKVTTKPLENEVQLNIGEEVATVVPSKQDLPISNASKLDTPRASQSIQDKTETSEIPQIKVIKRQTGKSRPTMVKL